jgi:3-hydroxyisobutyrate dehydrogenase
MKIAYIGLGDMGGDQARLLSRSEHDVSVYDLSPEARARFSDIARVTDSTESAAADAEIVHVCVRDANQVNDVLFGSGNLASAAKPGTLILVHSTIDVDSVRNIADKLAGHGQLLADAPVTRTAPDESGRFVLTMFGGDADSFEKARPALETFSTSVLHAGECGAAMALKIANNMMTWAQLVVGDLVFQMADAHQIDWESVKTVTKANGNLTPVTEAFLGGSRSNRSNLTPEQWEFIVSQAGIGEKDLSLAIDACRNNGIDTRMIEVARELLRTAMTGDSTQEQQRNQ